MSDLLPYTMVDDPWVTGALMTAQILVLASVALCMSTIRLQVQSVFAPLGSRKGTDSARMQDTYAARCLLAASTVGLAVGMTVMVACAVPSGATDGMHFAQRLLLASVFIGLRRLLMGMVNWTFFTAESVYRWSCVYRLKTCTDALLLLFLAQTSVSNSLPASTAAIVGISAVIPGFMLLTWGTWRLFFGKMLGCLHFLLYLCTLELLLAFLAVVAQIEITMPTWASHIAH